MVSVACLSIAAKHEEVQFLACLLFHACCPAFLRACAASCPVFCPDCSCCCSGEVSIGTGLHQHSGQLLQGRGSDQDGEPCAAVFGVPRECAHSIHLPQPPEAAHQPGASCLRTGCVSPGLPPLQIQARLTTAGKAQRLKSTCILL